MNTQHNAAVERLTKWLSEYRKGRQYDQEVFHGLHVGTDREAELRPADLATALSAYATQAERIKELETKADRRNSKLAEDVAALSLVRMSRGWQYMADETREIIDRALSATPSAAPSLPADVVALVKALTWFDQNRGLSLEFDWSDADTDGLDWCVYREHGGINDREWDLVANAPTPQAAILAAFSARSGQTKSVTMLVDQDWLSKHTATDPDSSVEAGPDVFADRVSPAVAEQTEGEG